MQQNNETHWDEAKRTAKNYLPVCSIAFAQDHLEALLDTRLMVKPEDFNKEQWEEYKDTTTKIGLIIEAIKNIRIN